MKRAIAAGTVVLLVALAAPRARSQDARDAKDQAGPLSELLMEGVEAAPVTSGQVFALTLSKDFRPLAGNPSDIRIAGVKGTLRVSFEQLDLSGERLHAILRLKNTTPSTLEGLRVDVLEAAESTFQKAPDGTNVKDSMGAPLLDTTRRAIQLIPSALWFGSLPPDGERTLLFQVTPVAFGPDAAFVIVTGVVTGLAATASVEVPGVRDVSALDVDGAGRVYLADGPAGRVLRLNADLKDPREIVSFGEPVRSLSVDRKNGEIVAASAATQALLRLAPFKTKPGALAAAAAIRCLRRDREGVLYGSPEKAMELLRFRGQGAASEVDRKIAAEGEIVSFDLDRTGVAWVVSAFGERREVFGADKAGKPLVRLREGGPGRLGGTWKALSCRLDGAGRVYVAEEAAGDGRISLFDDRGRLIRVLSSSGPIADFAVAPDGGLITVSAGPATVRAWRPF